MNTRILITLLTLAALGFGARAEDRTCPTLVHPEYALGQKPLPVRLMANAATYGFLYFKYGAEYLASVVGRGEPPPRTNLYQRPLYVEARALCPGDPVLLDGRPGHVVSADGHEFPVDPDRRAVFGVPTDADNYLREEGALVVVAISNADEIASADRVAVADDTLYLPPLARDGQDGVVKVGDAVGDCGGTVGAFRRVYALPGQLVRDPGEQMVEFGTPAELVAVKNICVDLAPARQLEVEVRGYADEAHRRARVIGYRGYDRIKLRFDDGQTKVVTRGMVLKL